MDSKESKDFSKSEQHYALNSPSDDGTESPNQMAFMAFKSTTIRMYLRNGDLFRVRDQVQVDFAQIFWLTWIAWHATHDHYVPHTAICPSDTTGVDETTLQDTNNSDILLNEGAQETTAQDDADASMKEISLDEPDFPVNQKFEEVEDEDGPPDFDEFFKDWLAEKKEK
ncbi:hypothetical protein JR316_0010653 [Psilocybe cubensis]|uniref:Uncharacterized protein n=2 Tax=Psilocybe cubensis TaxID=181762 RepID=A0A8H7XXN8_PSICU|nr:hypothetical protein JR316_0010653 [Psilocybe cubensis]KAH9476738.1 hypothetical protein JR316_0010653 [Psilocybe cubensis]